MPSRNPPRPMPSSRPGVRSRRLMRADYPSRACVYLGPGGSAGGSWAGRDGGQRRRHVLQRLALGVDADDPFDDAADRHDRGADQEADEEPAGVLALADERAVEDRADGAEALRDGEEDRDGLGPDLQREDLADRQVRRAGTRRREEEDDAPGDRLRRRVQ